jgi:hypothetical protein
MRRAEAAALLVATALVAARAHAFPQGSQFDDDPVGSAGGGGVHFTASPSFAAGTCATCHVNPPGALGVHLAATDATLFSFGYQPGETYELELSLAGEVLGDEYNGPARCGHLRGQFVPCNSNGFALEADDLVGDPVGALCPSLPAMTCMPARSATTVLSQDGTAIHHAGYLEADPAANLPAGFENGATAWRFYWTAPGPGTGPVTFHIGAVDGNGGAGTSDVPQDVYGDDTIEAHLTVAEAGGAMPEAAAGCAVGRRGGTGLPLIACLLLVGIVRRRRT